MTDRDALWRAILAAPDDAAPKLALIDLLDEAGDDPDLAGGLRYCLAHGRWPDEDDVKGAPAWTWHFFEDKRIGPYGPSWLPVKVWRKIAHNSRGLKYCGYGAADARSPVTAVRRLGRAVRQLGAQ